MNGKIIHGFRFFRSERIEELSATLHEAVYEKNGASLVFLERKDENKTFAIAFKTIPEDDTGVFHILEHSVLCGSRKFPVKEPFVELLKSSLKTFLNAFTFPDKTMYPVCSRNNKDFLNLIDVYMDAVLYPTAKVMPEIFRQEGWHHELSESGDLSYKGVVFNEMKGAYSSADEVGVTATAKLLYKGTAYGYDSGGDPECIPDLTYEQFVRAHDTYYHPSSARIFLDGSVDLDSVLAMLDGYLCDFEKKEVLADIDFVTPAGALTDTVSYEISPNDDPEGKERVYLGFLASDYTQRRRSIAISAITEAIAATNECALKKALMDSGLMCDAGFIPYDGIMQSSLIFEMKDMKKENSEQAISLFYDTIRDICKNGIDRDQLEACLCRMEFRARELDTGSYPLGISLAISALDSWLYGADPKEGLIFEEDFAALKEALTSDYYERLLEEVILNSKHSVTVNLVPSPTLGTERDEKERTRLKGELDAMTDADKARLCAEYDALTAWQKAPDSKQALATIPSICISDIDKEPAKYEYDTEEIDGKTVYRTIYNTRGITYTDLFFDISDFSADELFYSSILCDLFGAIRTENSSAAALQARIKKCLGSFSISSAAFTKDGEAKPYIRLRTAAIDQRLTDAEQIIKEVIFSTVFDECDTIKKIVKQTKLSVADGLAYSGHTVAIARAGAYLFSEYAITEHTEGLEFYLRLKELDKDIEQRIGELTLRLAALSKRIFTYERLTVFTCGKQNTEFASRIIKAMPKDGICPDKCSIRPLGIRNEGVIIPAGVAFSAKGVDINLSDPLNAPEGSFAVAKSILSLGYLWSEVRVQGGAYGSGLAHRAQGLAAFYSYRDPSPMRSAKIFDRSPEFLEQAAEEEGELTGFIIGAIGDSDPLITPKTASAYTIAQVFRGQSYEQRAKKRKEILATCPADLKKCAERLRAALKTNGVCVVGSREKLKECEEILENYIEI